MLHHLLWLTLLCGLQEILAAPPQVPLALANVAAGSRPRKLQGRFLHLTDMHPDPYYRAGTSEKSACHRKKPKKKPRAGEFGYLYGECDSPLVLTDYTLDFLEKNWLSEIDFVIWTGDSARHDNDRKLPRTLKEIYQLNRVLARRMEAIFTKRGIPVIPSIGNNDVWPHNIMMPGPNDVTSEFSSIWKSFVPFNSYQVFQRGGYYSVEVIPDSLAIISLNTMYFFDSNKAVGGCEQGDSDDPGNLQFDWLEVQLEAFRSRGMQVWISGHVPPHARSYHPECHVRYVKLSLRYQDTILGQLFGHMNVDHFFFLDSRKLPGEDDMGEVETDGKHRELYKSLLKTYGQVKKEADHDSLSVVNVSPSVVPNPYLPSFRIFAYNISGSRYTAGVLGETDGTEGHRLGDSGSERWHTSPDAPSRTNRLYSPLGFAQYYMPDLNGTAEQPPKWRLEYLTFAPAALHPPKGTAPPIPLKQLPRSLRNATRTRSRYAPYRMADLTLPSWTNLARQLAQTKNAKLRKRFRRFMYMGADEEL